MNFSMILIQLYWLSFTYIGISILLLIRSFLKPRKKYQRIYKYINSRHPLVLLFFATSLGLSTMAISLVPSYLLRWPTEIMIWVYAVLTVISLFIGVLNYRILFKYLRRLTEINKKSLLWVAAILCVVLFNYAVWLHVGGSLQLDSPVQLAHLTSVASGHTSLRDPYFGNNGVYDVRYSVNPITSLAGIGAKLLNVAPLTMWLYSYAWLGLLTLIAIFSLCWELLQFEGRRLIAYVSIALTPFLFIGYFFNSQMPNEEVLLWVILLVIGLKVLYDTKNSWILLLAAILIAATQPINCVMAVGFLVFVGGLLIVSRSLNKQYGFALMGAIAIMSLTVLLQLHFPNRLKLDHAAFYAEEGTGNTITPHHYGPFLIAQIHLGFTALQLAIYAIISSCIVLFSRFNNRLKPRYILLLPLTIFLGLEIWAYNTLLLIVIGLIYLIVFTKSRPMRLTILAMGLYYNVLAYNPVVIYLAKDRLPWWFLARFEYFNVLVFPGLLTGIFALHIWPAMKWRFNKVEWVCYLALSAVIIIPIAKANHNFGIVISTNNSYQKPYADALQQIYELRSQLQDKVIMSDDGDITLRIPQVIRANVVSFAHDQNASPMSNLPLRKKCNAQLMANLNPIDLQAARVDTIVTRISKPRFVELLSSKPYIKFQAQAGNIRVYSVSLPKPRIPITPETSICAIPPGQ